MTALILILWQPLFVLAGMAIWIGIGIWVWVFVATITDRVKAWMRHDKRRART